MSTPPVDPFGGSNPKAAAKAAKAYAKAERPWFKKKRFIIPGVVVALALIVPALGGGGDEDTKADSKDKATSEAKPAEKKAEKTEAAKPAEKKKPKATSGQKNALKAAENYLDFQPFSRKGLIQQLSSDAGDGYSVEDATYAADNVKVDWNEQAAKAAKNYLDISPFSRQGLIDQLSSDAGDGYTLEQATHGADKAGV